MKLNRHGIMWNLKPTDMAKTKTKETMANVCSFIYSFPKSKQKKGQPGARKNTPGLYGGRTQNVEAVHYRF